MKKGFKKLAIVGGLVGCLTISAVGVSAYANGNAYQNYKDAAFQTLKEQNMTVTADITLKQDGNVFVTGNASVQMDGQNDYSCSRIQIGSKLVEMEESSIDGVKITRRGDEYVSRTEKEDDRNEKDFTESSATVKLVEMVADLLVGDVKTHFTGNENNVTVNLDGAQIPELLNVAASAAIEQSANYRGKNSPETEMFGNVFENLAITQDIQIKTISLNAELKDNKLGDNIITIVLTGKDSSGNAHEIELLCSASISDIGSTVPVAVNTEGKTVTEATWDSYNHHD